MIAQDIIDDVLTIFGDKQEVQVQQEDILRWINDAQLRVVRETDCIIRETSYVSTPGDSGYTLSDDFMKFHRVTYDGKKLDPTNSSELDILDRNRDTAPSATGIPARYYRKGDQMVLYPKPDGVYTIVVEYIARPTPVEDGDDTLEIPDQFCANVKQLCLARCYELDENFSLAQAKEKRFEDSVLTDRDEYKNPNDDTYPSVRDVSGYW